MNGIHDFGGMHGLGPVVAEVSEPVFHDDWERRVFALFPALFAGGLFNVDEFRHAIERMSPAEYLSSQYYEHWLHSFETLLIEKGVVTHAELESGKAASGKVASPALKREMVETLVKTGGSTRMNEAVAPSFKVGDRVRAKNFNPTTHTRLPRYARGKLGTIEIDHGVFVTPDTAAHGKGAHPQHVYCVNFTAAELWGEGASSVDTVRIDLWDDYLEKA